MQDPMIKLDEMAVESHLARTLTLAFRLNASKPSVRPKQ